MLYRVGEHAICESPIQEIALPHRAFTHDLVVDEDRDSMASAKRVKVTTSEVGQCNFVAMVYIEQRSAAALADNVELLAVVRDQPIERAQRDAAFLIH